MLANRGYDTSGRCAVAPLETCAYTVLTRSTRPRPQECGGWTTYPSCWSHQLSSLVIWLNS